MMRSGDMRVVRELETASWQAFVDEQPQGNVFHTPQMADVFAASRGHRSDLWAAMDGREVLALLLPVRVSFPVVPRTIFTTRSIVYGGPLCRDDEVGRDAFALLLRAYEEDAARRSLFTEFRNLSDTSTLAPVFEHAGYSFEGHLNYLLDLDRPTEELLAAMSSKTRWEIRRGLRDERLIVADASDGEVGALYGLLEETYRRLRVPLPDRSMFDAIQRIMRPHDMATLLLARVGEEPVAASVQLQYRDRIVGWYAGSTRGFSRDRPNEALIWHIVLQGKEGGFRILDFGGAGKPEEDYGPRRFKAKFAGELVDFGRYVRVHAPLRMRLSSLGYRVYRRVPRSGAST
jgi:serine/alanine adding enzyme